MKIQKNRIHLLILLFAVSSLLVHSPPDAFADTGDVTSTVEINDSTTNGPSLADNDLFGISVANIGDLDGDGVNDIAVGENGMCGCIGGGRSGAVYIMFMNTDGSIDSTVEINDSTANGPSTTRGFGYGMTNIGDLDGDGVNDIAVGAFRDING